MGELGFGGLVVARSSHASRLWLPNCERRLDECSQGVGFRDPPRVPPDADLRCLLPGVLDHWLDVGLAAAPTRTRVFLFGRRNRPDFDERDRLVLDLLQPHLAARAEAAETALRGAAALAALEEGASEDASGVVLCGRKGVIEFASPSSRAVLERYLGIENGRVPLAVLGRRKIRLAHADRRLDVRIAQTDNLHVLMLDERDTRIEQLTKRERQILEHVALGKENDEIALELGLASATVAKHLEHVYRKLGVPNRTAAAARLDRS